MARKMTARGREGCFQRKRIRKRKREKGREEGDSVRTAKRKETARKQFDTVKDSAGGRSSRSKVINPLISSCSIHPAHTTITPFSVNVVSFETTTRREFFLSGSQRFQFLDVFL